jgi:ABC-type multidrug transport system ATPase subunit
VDDTDTTIRFEAVSLRLAGKPVVEGFSLRVASGEKVTLAGPSGCGKTSLLRAVLGFVVPDAGTVSVGGEAVTAESVWRLRRRMAYVPQEPDLGRGTVRSVLERPFSYRHNGGRPVAPDEAVELFDGLKLPRATMDAEVADLSGGEKQRVAIASALLLRRELLLLDEASSALDEESRDAVLALLRSRGPLTILSVSHDPEGFRVGGRVVRMAMPGAAGEGGRRP